jgi:hypothetical protein
MQRFQLTADRFFRYTEKLREFPLLDSYRSAPANSRHRLPKARRYSITGDFQFLDLAIKCVCVGLQEQSPEASAILSDESLELGASGDAQYGLFPRNRSESPDLLRKK